MRHRRRNGLILLLVVSMIPLIGIVSATLTVNGRNLLVRARLQAVEEQARAAVESGLAWAAVHAERVAAFKPGQEAVLELDTDPVSSCAVTFVSADQEQTVVQVTGTAKSGRFSASHKKTAPIRTP
jgi:hypothetical protein